MNVFWMIFVLHFAGLLECMFNFYTKLEWTLRVTRLFSSRDNFVFAIVAEVFDLFFVKTKYFDK